MRSVVCILGCVLILLLTKVANAQEVTPEATDEAADLQPAPDFIVEAEVSVQTPYIGEQLLYVFRYFTYTVPPGLFDQLPDFEGFWLSDIYELSGGRVESINNRQYIVGELYAEITPLRTGQITIEPSVLEIPETVFSEGATLETDPITLDVLPLPEDAPETFNGAVGQFNVVLDVDRNSVTLGQPLTLTLTVDGTGNLEQLPAPELPDIEGWRVYANPTRFVPSTVGGIRFGQKVFEWLVVPENAGTQTYPPVSFTYFDPQIGVYETVASSEIVVEVFPGADNLRALPTPNAANGSGALAIRVVPDRLTVAQSEQFSVLEGILWIVPPIVTLVAGGWVYGRAHADRRQREERRQTALARATRRLEESLSYPPQIAGNRVEAVLLGYFEDLSGEVITDSNRAQQLLLDSGFDAETYQTLNTLFSRVESLRYVPEGLPSDLPDLVHRAIATLTYIDALWTHDSVGLS